MKQLCVFIFILVCVITACKPVARQEEPSEPAGLNVIVKKGFDLNKFLIKAARGGQLDLVKNLRSRGADDLNWAMVVAAEKGYLHVVKYLRSEGADNLDEAMVWAKRGGHRDVINYLLSEGAS